MKTTIITGIYDNYDALKLVCPQSIEVEWICVTDNEYLVPAKNRDGWKIVYEPRNHIHPNRAAKLPKMLPWLYANTDTSIWIDASFQVMSKTFAEDVLQYAQPIAQFNHPWRGCAYAEAKECIAIPKYSREVLREQIAHLQNTGFPINWGLWATGVIARQHTPEIISMGFDWMKEIYTWSYQDQVSHPYACWKNGLRPTNFPGTHLANKWLAYQGSTRHNHG